MNSVEAARRLYASGRLRESAAMLGEILRRSPNDAEAMQLLGAIQFQLGYQRDGIKLVERAVSLSPDNPEAWNNLGLMRHMMGQDAAAEAAFSKAVAIHPGYANAWRNLGFVLQASGRHEEALRALDESGPAGAFFRGNSYAALGEHGKAIAEFDIALDQDPANADAWHNRGNSLVAIGRPADGVESIKRALSGMGQAPLPHCNLAVALLASGRVDEALGIVEHVLKWDPNLARAQELRQQILDQIKVEERAASELANGPETPDNVKARTEFALSLQSQGKWRESLTLVENAKDEGLRFLDALLMPVIFASGEMAEDALRRLATKVDRLIEDRPLLEDPLAQVGITTFHLPYFGVSERPYQEAIASAYLHSAPSLGFTAGHTPGTGRIKLGICSAYFTDHTISRVFGELVQKLDRDRFDTVFLQIGKSDDYSDNLAARMDSHVHLPNGLSDAREAIAREELDLLFYPEIGMHPLTYYLAFSRLAPIQFTTWGHPLTTGSPAMDYFVSSVHLEREDAQEEYTEKLVRLPSLNAYYSRPPSPTQWSRSDFGLPEGKRLYGCLQMPYKFHPDYDAVLADILDQDRDGALVLIEPQRPYLKEVLVDRWRRSHPILLERVIWLHLMPLERYLRLTQLCDALLAPIHFGAGRSTLDALAVGSPVVTYQGRYLKSRITYAAYKQIGFDELIAESEEEYVQLALRLARDSSWQREIRRAIRERSAPLFENESAISEFNGFLADLATEVR
jgi:protein O-GlcNAc transferase